MTLDLAKLRAAVEARNPHPRTHSDECYLWDDHRDCAILRLLDAYEALLIKSAALEFLCQAGAQDLARAKSKHRNTGSSR